MIRAAKVDAVTVLSVFLALRFAIPSVLTVPALGGAGGPATLFGLGCLVWWGHYHLQRDRLLGEEAAPVRRAAILMFAVFVCSYVAANLRPIDASETSVADLSMVSLTSWMGVLLIAHDGLQDLSRTRVLLRRLVLWAAVLSVLGLVQFFTKELYVDKISIPGLTGNAVLGDLGVREGFNRASGTALHAIEFGAVLTLILPVSLALAYVDVGRSSVRRWFPPMLIALAVAVSVSRSAILGGAVGMLILAGGLTRSARSVLAGGVFMLATLIFLTVPGFAGTMLGLFTGVENDTSVASRTGSYPLAGEFISRSPLFGRGFGTFVPAYRILDNAYLLLAIEVGLVGVAAVVLLFFTAARASLRAPRRATDQALINRGLSAGITAGAVELALFDGFSFPMFAGLLFMVVGVAGATSRLTQRHEDILLTAT